MSADQVWQQLTEAGQFERHFNQLQATYRALASTWLLATFTGIGFTIVNAKSIESISVDWLLMAAGVALAGAIGIGLIWNLDLLVYHRLLDVIFHTARTIEEDHPQMPPFRINMMGVTKTGGVLSHVVWYYIVGIDLLLLVASAALALELAKYQWPWPAALVGGVVLIVAVTIAMERLKDQYRQDMRKFFRIDPKSGGDGARHWTAATGTWTKPS